jgi:thiamine-phosphate pyrophosphorylase
MNTKTQKMQKFCSARLYLVTSKELSNAPTLQILREALQVGCKLFQLREKTLKKHEYKELAMLVRSLANKYGALFIVNDHVDVAKEVGADGVHLGQEDMSVADARKILGDEFIIGVSTHNVEEAVKAQQDGADYINIGPVFPTNTKPFATSLGLEGIKKILPHVNIPFTFMGGIKLENVEDLRPFKPAAVAVITELTRSSSLSVDISTFLS